MAVILPIRRKGLINQSINQSIKCTFLTFLLPTNLVGINYCDNGPVDDMVLSVGK